MQSKDLLLVANRQCVALVMPLLEDLATAALVSPTPNPGNHAHWVLGHLVLSEGQFRTMMDGTPNPGEAYEPLFGGGSHPDATGSGYPPYHELLNQLIRLHESTLVWLESMPETQLDQPSQRIPPGFEPLFGTWRQVLLMRALHWMNHRGQLADCRHAAGRPPLLA